MPNTPLREGWVYERGQWNSPDAIRRRLVTAVLCAAKKRAKRERVPFDLTLDHMDVLFLQTTHCPVTGEKLVRGNASGRDNSPSIDRVVPALGYVPGNVRIISNRVNRLKGSLTLHQVEQLVSYMKGTVK